MLLTALAGQDLVVALSAGFAVLALSAVFAWGWRSQLRALLRNIREVRARTANVRAMEKVLPDLVRLLGPDHPDTLATRIYLAKSRAEAEGDAAAAASAFEELLADCLRVLGPDHPDTWMAQSELDHWQWEARYRRPHPQ